MSGALLDAAVEVPSSTEGGEERAFGVVGSEAGLARLGLRGAAYQAGVVSPGGVVNSMLA
jgi:hypothetical protein